ncbi:exonuclease/endonuclease/phosphatase family protein [Microlunatus parietis]|uniref:Endonuclease/exonuclease/phosphatase family metal-dependent hydrolase n=1 Tax=Microlunatus parietis TaxID=682979 RepID=A0A7Y9LCK8_9ACTN|nr:hypothetical protein [Microlunatus parietis]NYE71790.1 endonuclease/exonuclease/phosphatase family metal-dependent hydrolase [Microlunatus parietis]
MNLVHGGRLVPAAIMSLVILVAGAVQATPARAADPPVPGQIAVLTQNQSLGADLRPVLNARDQPTFQHEIRKALKQVADNPFQVRALAFAYQIVKADPDVVALQEVFDLRRNGEHAAGPYRDHLADTLAALDLLGGRYRVVARVQNMSTTFPVDLDRNGSLETQVGLAEHDVILVREGLTAAPVPFPDLCLRPSLDGCQFQVVSIATDLPNGRVNRERGFVGIDVSLNGRAFRVVNTQLEEFDVEPETGPISRTFQTFQASELITMIEASNPSGRTVVVLGDLASTPDDETILLGTLPVVPGYIVLQTNGFRDALTLDPDNLPLGDTCCQAPDLRNRKSRLDRRVDHVFTTDQPVEVHSDVLGDSELERRLLKRWPSDHGTVYARIRYQ